jgi:hypothetical protein
LGAAFKLAEPPTLSAAVAPGACGSSGLAGAAEPIAIGDDAAPI